MLLFAPRTSRIKSSESIGDDNEVKETFFFHTHECFSRITDLFCLFVHMGRFLIHGNHVVVGATGKFSRISYHFYPLECLYAEERSQ